MANGRCRMHGGKNPGAPRGNTNALLHGDYTAEAIAQRRETARMRRESRRALNAQIDAVMARWRASRRKGPRSA